MFSTRSGRTSQALVGALALALAFPGLAAANSYAGEDTVVVWQGINGYIYQATTSSNTAVHATFINICPDQSCTHWVQVGTIQGDWNGGNDPGNVEYYRENKDACGDYYADDLGAPPSPNFPYSLNWDGKTYQVIPCNNGTHHSAYTWLYRKGGVTTTPFWEGTLETSSGVAIAETEYHAGATYATDYVGCTATHTCATSAYGLHLYWDGTWQLMTAVSNQLSGNPPYLHQYNAYWSFKSCPTSC